MKRISWDEYFMHMAQLASYRSTCIRRAVGAVIVKDNHIISTGYNGAPTGQVHCRKCGCIRDHLNVPSGERHELCRGVHAEQNCIIQAAKHGGIIDQATMYVTHQPCFICAKMLVNAGIVRVVYKHEYSDIHTLELFQNAGVEYVKTV